MRPRRSCRRSPATCRRSAGSTGPSSASSPPSCFLASSASATPSRSKRSGCRLPLPLDLVLGLDEPHPFVEVDRDVARIGDDDETPYAEPVAAEVPRQLEQ